MLGKEAGTEARVRVFAWERLYKDEAWTRVVVPDTTQLGCECETTRVWTSIAMVAGRLCSLRDPVQWIINGAPPAVPVPARIRKTHPPGSRAGAPSHRTEAEASIPHSWSWWARATAQGHRQASSRRAKSECLMWTSLGLDITVSHHRAGELMPPISTESTDDARRREMHGKIPFSPRAQGTGTVSVPPKRIKGPFAQKFHSPCCCSYVREWERRSAVTHVWE